MIIVMPIDRQRLIEICRSTLRPLSTVRKLSDASDSATTISASAASDWKRAKCSLVVELSFMRFSPARAGPRGGPL